MSSFVCIRVVLVTLGLANVNKSIAETIEYPIKIRISMRETEAPNVVLNVSSPFHVRLILCPKKSIVLKFSRHLRLAESRSRSLS